MSLRDRAEAAVRESKFVAFKANFDPASDALWCELVKDIVAFANSGGGVILFGVANNGQATAHDPTSLVAMDPVEITNRIAHYTGVAFSDFEIATVLREGRAFTALLIEGSAVPIPFTRDGTYDIGDGRRKTAFARGTIYVRHGAKSDTATPRDMKAWRDKVVAAARKDWLGGIRKVVTAPAGHTVTIVPATDGGPSAKVIHGALSAAAKGRKVAVQNAEDIWPLRRKDLLRDVNRRIAPLRISPYDVQCANWKLDVLKNHPEFAYKPHHLASPQYSREYADWFVEKARDPSFFSRLRDEYRSFRLRSSAA